MNVYSLDVAAPFGGVKTKGLGEMGAERLQPYFSLKSIYTTAKAKRSVAAGVGREGTTSDRESMEKRCWSLP